MHSSNENNLELFDLANLFHGKSALFDSFCFDQADLEKNGKTTPQNNHCIDLKNHNDYFSESKDVESEGNLLFENLSICSVGNSLENFGPESTINFDNFEIKLGKRSFFNDKGNFS